MERRKYNPNDKKCNCLCCGLKIRDFYLNCSLPMDMYIDEIDIDDNNDDPEIITEEERYEKFSQRDHKRSFGLNADSLLKEAERSRFYGKKGGVNI